MYDIRLCDAIEMLRSLDDGSVDLILTDPPYPKKFEHLFAQMAEVAASKLKVGGSLVTLCGHHQVIRVGHEMSLHLRFWWCGGMLHTTLKRLAGKWVCIQGKPMLWYVRERRRVGDTQCPIDYMEGGGKDKRFHAWGQPVHWFKHWIERLTNPGDLVVDPFIGGGTTAVAAVELGRRCIGAELDPEQYAVAMDRLKDISPLQRKRVDVMDGFV